VLQWVKLKTAERILSGANWQRALKQKGVKQTGAKQELFVIIYYWVQGDI